MEISIFFGESVKCNSFRRIDELHPLDLYLGKNAYNKNTLLLITDKEPPLVCSSRLIHVAKGLRQDERWAVSFVLEDESFIGLFCRFCEDIAEASRLLKEKDKGVEFVIERYLKWQEMLKKVPSCILSPEEIKGLIGELYFLNNFLIDQLGEDVAINSWVGPEKTDQDFICPNLWYEIKALSSGAVSAEISSIEQLDVESEGELVLVYLDKTSKTGRNKITLNSIVDETEEKIINSLLKLKFRQILLDFGYVRMDEYEEYPYAFAKMVRYRVTKDFPAIRRATVAEAIVSAKYKVSIADINTYTKD